MSYYCQIRRLLAEKAARSAVSSFARSELKERKITWGYSLSVNTHDIAKTLATLFGELVEGAPASGAYILNAGDAGLLRSIDKLSAAAASVPTSTGSTIAAHVDHVRYGLGLLNRWAAGEENPFADADWNASWQRATVTDEKWQQLRDSLRREADKWQAAVAARQDWDDLAAAGTIASVAHTAYHLGAIRQILAAMGK